MACHPCSHQNLLPRQTHTTAAGIQPLRERSPPPGISRRGSERGGFGSGNQQQPGRERGACGLRCLLQQLLDFFWLCVSETRGLRLSLEPSKPSQDDASRLLLAPWSFTLSFLGTKASAQLPARHPLGEQPKPPWESLCSALRCVQGRGAQLSVGKGWICRLGPASPPIVELRRLPEPHACSKEEPFLPGRIRGKGKELWSWDITSCKARTVSVDHRVCLAVLFFPPAKRRCSC